MTMPPKTPDAAPNFPIVVDQWAKNERDTLRVAIDHFHDRDIIDLRLWWVDAAGTLKPGKSGLTVAMRHLPRLAAAVAKALAEAEARGMVQTEGGGE